MAEWIIKIKQMLHLLTFWFVQFQTSRYTHKLHDIWTDIQLICSLEELMLESQSQSANMASKNSEKIA